MKTLSQFSDSVLLWGPQLWPPQMRRTSRGRTLVTTNEISACRMSQSENEGPLYRRWWKVWPSRCCLPCNTALRPCRTSVSQNKRRYRQDGFDLDLTYITKRIIVHGFPATGVEHIYRNPRSEVQRLLDKYHEGHYKVYNFTNEPGRTYPEHLFHGRVERYPFSDHTCPPLESVVDFCESAKAWLDMDEENVVALHCKAGKGRAGIMAACLMVRLGDTAEAAINKYDSIRVSNMKGLTVVNQRKWPVLYERLIREVWGLQGRVGIVPGQDPDLRAPKPRVTCLREVSVQLQLQTATGKRNDKLLSNLSYVVYQQHPRGKTIVHGAKMQRVVPVDGEPSIVFSAALPRSAEVTGTFEVVFTAAVGAASTKKEVMVLWWNTAFLAPEGGDQTFELLEMDVSPLKLKIRLEQASARVILRHTPQEVPSPIPHAVLKRETTARAPDDAGDTGQSEEAQPSPEPTRQGGGRNEESRPNVATPPGDQPMPESETSKQEDGEAPLDQREVPRDVGSNDQSGPGDDEIVVRTMPPPPSPSQPQPTPAEERALGADKDDSATGPSPAFPGPSPAGVISPAWTFEGAMSSVSDRSARSVGDSRWSRAKMWARSQGVSSGGVSTPQDRESRKVDAPVADRGSGLRSKRRAAALRKRQGSAMGGKNTSVLVPGLPKGVPRETVSATWNSVRQGRVGDESIVHGVITPRGERREREGCSRFSPQFETDSDSDDQVAVRASGFGRRRWRLGSGSGCGRGSGGKKEVLVGNEHRAQPRSATGSSSMNIDQRVMKMEMAFTKERRRWEEHRQCLETELDWALAARARAEARSEEDSAKVEVLETRLSAWRNECSAVERDVKQAVKLLEMSLSGLMAAESALRSWKGQIPEQAYEDVLSCLTKGDVGHKHVGPGRE